MLVTILNYPFGYIKHLWCHTIEPFNSTKSGGIVQYCWNAIGQLFLPWNRTWPPVNPLMKILAQMYVLSKSQLYCLSCLFVSSSNHKKRCKKRKVAIVLCKVWRLHRFHVQWVLNNLGLVGWMFKTYQNAGKNKPILHWFWNAKQKKIFYINFIRENTKAKWWWRVINILKLI